MAVYVFIYTDVNTLYNTNKSIPGWCGALVIMLLVATVLKKDIKNKAYLARWHTTCVVIIQYVV